MSQPCDVLGTEEVRQRISSLLDELGADPQRLVVIGRHRRPEAVLVPWSAWRAMTTEGDQPQRPGRGPNLGSWSQEEAIAYEVAEDLFGDLIGWCNAQAWAEREKPNPDRAVIEKWKREAERYIKEQQALDGNDPAAVARVIREYGPLVRHLYGQQRGVQDEIPAGHVRSFDESAAAVLAEGQAPEPMPTGGDLNEADVDPRGQDAASDPLADVELFSGLDPETRQRIMAAAVPRTYRKRQLLFAENDPGESLIMLRSGAVTIFRTSPSGERAILAVLRSPDVLGGVSLLDGSPRSTSAEAIEDTTALALSRDAFLELVHLNPQILDAVLSQRCSPLPPAGAP